MCGESEQIKVVYGCPQGAGLSPELWNNLVDDLPASLSDDEVQLLLFADDVTLVSSHKDISYLMKVIQDRINDIQCWAKKHCLKFSAEKTEAMFFTKKKKVRLDDFQIDNCNIKWVDTHKHLGLIIQNKLNWSAHVNYITERANIVLHQCKNMVGKTWGLTPLHVKYIYCCIVRQILAYGIIVWAPALRFKTNIKKLEKPQRIACRYISSARQSISLECTQVILNILPIKLFLEEAAIKTAARLVDADRWDRTIEGKFRHINYIESTAKVLGVNFILKRDIAFPPDYCIPKYDIEILSRDEIVEKNSPEGREVFVFTDGSKFEDGNVGCGLLIKSTDYTERSSWPLVSYATIFQAEIHAIYMSAHILLEYRHTIFHITFFIDSQAAIRALSALCASCKLVQECKLMLNKLSLRCNVKLSWIPSHVGFFGNEEADSLAKHGALNHDCLPTAYVPRSMQVFKIQATYKAIT